MMPALTSQETKQLLAFQTNEITEHHIYHQLSLLQKNENNRPERTPQALRAFCV